MLHNIHVYCLVLQVNLIQKLLFLQQLTQNMTTDCSLNYEFNTWKLQAQTWGEHVVYRNCFWHSEQFLYTKCSPPCSAKGSASDKNLPVTNQPVLVTANSSCRPHCSIAMIFFVFLGAFHYPLVLCNWKKNFALETP